MRSIDINSNIEFLEECNELLMTVFGNSISIDNLNCESPSADSIIEHLWDLADSLEEGLKTVFEAGRLYGLGILPKLN